MSSRKPNDLPEALARLRKPLFMQTPKYGEQQHRANRVGADRDIVEFEWRFIRRFQKLDIPMFCDAMVRTAEEQQALVDQKVSKDSPSDGLWPHMGFAVDLIHGVLGWALPDASWQMIGHIGKEVAAQAGIKVVWGGDWKFYDPAHWELADWRERAKRRG